MIGLLLQLGILGSLAALAGGLLFVGQRTFRTPTKYGDSQQFEGSVTFAFGVVSLLTFLFVLAVIVGDITFVTVPDGCYKIGHASGTGVGTGITSDGRITTTVITVSDRVYIPIACP